MGLKFVILWFSCLTLLTSPALASAALARAVAEHALHGVSLMGSGLALKGTAAVLGAKGLARLALKTAAVKGALLAKSIAIGKGAIIGAVKIGAALLATPATTTVPPPLCKPECIAVKPPEVPTIMDILSGVWSNVQRKTEIVGKLLDHMNGKEETIVLQPPVLYEYIIRSRYNTVPVIEEIELF